MNICVLFQYKIFRNRYRYFFDTKFFRNRYRYFFRYQIFSKPIPILFSIPIFFETDTDTFFDTKFFRNQYRYFFRYQNFSKPIPIPSKKMEKFRNREVSKPKCHTLGWILDMVVYIHPSVHTWSSTIAHLS